MDLDEVVIIIIRCRWKRRICWYIIVGRTGFFMDRRNGFFRNGRIKFFNWRPS